MNYQTKYNSGNKLKNDIARGQSVLYCDSDFGNIRVVVLSKVTGRVYAIRLSHMIQKQMFDLFLPETTKQR